VTGRPGTPTSTLDCRPLIPFVWQRVKRTRLVAIQYVSEWTKCESRVFNSLRYEHCACHTVYMYTGKWWRRKDATAAALISILTKSTYFREGNTTYNWCPPSRNFQASEASRVDWPGAACQLSRWSMKIPRCSREAKLSLESPPRSAIGGKFRGWRQAPRSTNRKRGRDFFIRIGRSNRVTAVVYKARRLIMGAFRIKAITHKSA